jgi:hypothetical protein
MSLLWMEELAFERNRSFVRAAFVCRVSTPLAEKVIAFPSQMIDVFFVAKNCIPVCLNAFSHSRPICVMIGRP